MGWRFAFLFNGLGLGLGADDDDWLIDTVYGRKGGEKGDLRLGRGHGGRESR